MPSRLTFLICAVIGAFVLLGATFWIANELHDTTARRLMIRNAYERRLAAAELMEALAQAESAQRGYVVTGDRAFLDSYGAAHAQVEGDLSRSGAAIADGGDGARLRTLIDARFREMDLVIALRARSGLAPAAARIATGTGVGLMAQTRALAADLAGSERETMQSQIADLLYRYASFVRRLWMAMLVLGAALLAGIALVWRGRAQRYALECKAHDITTRLMAMFAENAEAMFVLDGDGRIEAANAAAKRLLGYRARDLLGRQVTSLFDLEDERDFRTRIGLADGKLAQHIWLDRTARNRDGSGVSVDVSLGVMDMPDGQHLLMMMRDIAERKSIDRLKDEFLATISHELRTPLTSVVGALGLLRKGAAGALPDGADRLVAIAENNSRRLIRLVNDLLDIEKIGSGQMRFDRVPVDLAHIAETAVDGALGIARERGVRIEIAADEGASVVRGDRDRLLQVLANLLSNAIRVSPDAGMVTVAVARRGGEVSVIVDDEGPGIPAEFTGRIFERFAQASDAEGGSGLGLAISREIVVAHDGRIWFGRSPAGGARFGFALPLSRIEEPLRGSRPCILLAEGDPDEAQRLQAMLEAAGCAIESVASDRATLAAAISGRHDALLIDIELPAMGGLETLRALRRRTETRGVPVVLLSADAVFEAGRDQGPALGPVEWIGKPVERDALAAAIRRAVADSVGTRPTLLHIDDDVDMLEIAAAVLAEQGRVVHATSLASARALIAMQAPDLVILDLLLPDGSGSLLLPELVRADGTPIPTIIYSAIDVPPELEHRVDAVLVKSRRSLDSLARVVRRILATRSQDAATRAQDAMTAA